MATHTVTRGIGHQSQWMFTPIQKREHTGKLTCSLISPVAQSLDSTNPPPEHKPQQNQQNTNTMKTTITTTQAANMLADDQNSSFSRSGAYALVEYLEEMEESCGEEMEFDSVALRCDYSEYESLQEWAEDYFSAWRADLSIDDDMDDDQIDDTIREYINDHGQLIEFNGGIIVSSF